MVKNTTGGKGAKSAKSSSVQSLSELVIAEDGQIYALVQKMLGDRRIMVKLNDGQEIMAHIPGRFNVKSSRVTPGCHVLLNLREYQSDKADVAYVYSAAESKRLVKIGEIIENVQKETEEASEERDISFDEL